MDRGGRESRGSTTSTTTAVPADPAPASAPGPDPAPAPAGGRATQGVPNAKVPTQAQPLPALQPLSQRAPSGPERSWRRWRNALAGADRASGVYPHPQQPLQQPWHRHQEQQQQHSKQQPYQYQQYQQQDQQQLRILVSNTSGATWLQEMERRKELHALHIRAGSTAEGLVVGGGSRGIKKKKKKGPGIGRQTEGRAGRAVEAAAAGRDMGGGGGAGSVPDQRQGQQQAQGLARAMRNVLSLRGTSPGATASGTATGTGTGTDTRTGTGAGAGGAPKSKKALVKAASAEAGQPQGRLGSSGAWTRLAGGSERTGALASQEGGEGAEEGEEEVGAGEGEEDEEEEEEEQEDGQGYPDSQGPVLFRLFSAGRRLAPSPTLSLASGSNFSHASSPLVAGGSPQVLSGYAAALGIAVERHARSSASLAVGGLDRPGDLGARASTWSSPFGILRPKSAMGTPVASGVLRPDLSPLVPQGGPVPEPPGMLSADLGDAGARGSGAQGLPLFVRAFSESGTVHSGDPVEGAAYSGSSSGGEEDSGAVFANKGRRSAGGAPGLKEGEDERGEDEGEEEEEEEEEQEGEVKDWANGERGEDQGQEREEGEDGKDEEGAKERGKGQEDEAEGEERKEGGEEVEEGSEVPPDASLAVIGRNSQLALSLSTYVDKDGIEWFKRGPLTEDAAGQFRTEPMEVPALVDRFGFIVQGHEEQPPGASSSTVDSGSGNSVIASMSMSRSRSRSGSRGRSMGGVLEKSIDGLGINVSNVNKSMGASRGMSPSVQGSMSGAGGGRNLEDGEEGRGEAEREGDTEREEQMGEREGRHGPDGGIDADNLGTGASADPASVGTFLGPLSKREMRLLLREEKEVLKWREMIGVGPTDFNAYLRRRPREVKRRIRRGVPDCLRGLVWQLISGSRELLIMNQGAYEHMLLYEHSNSEMDIIRDIDRTYPSHVYFKQKHGPGQRALFNVLKAYSVYDKKIGYVQGMGFLAGLLLLYMAEADAFWLLVAIMKGAMHQPLEGLFLVGLPLVQQCLFQFDGLLEEQLPRLAKHLRAEGVGASMYASQWFITIFAYNFPFPTTLRVWDVFLFEGMKTVFRVGLSILKQQQDQLLEMPFEELLPALRTYPDHVVDPDTLLPISFSFKVSQRLQELETEYAATMDPSPSPAHDQALPGAPQQHGGQGERQGQDQQERQGQGQGEEEPQGQGSAEGQGKGLGEGQAEGLGGSQAGEAQAQGSGEQEREHRQGQALGGGGKQGWEPGAEKREGAGASSVATNGEGTHR